MAYLTSQNIWRALVAQLRSNVALRAALTGGIHEGLAPENVRYPYIVWTPAVAGVKEDTWNTRMIISLADVFVISRSSVEASNLDQSVLETLDGASLSVQGQASLICHRVADLRFVDQDEEGRLVYRIGGSYEIVTNQIAGVRWNSSQFTLDAAFSS
jgi:hypothetical protein